MVVDRVFELVFGLSSLFVVVVASSVLGFILSRDSPQMKMTMTPPKILRAGRYAPVSTISQLTKPATVQISDASTGICMSIFYCYIFIIKI
jgi:succinyl-CoA synthetase alpha subunit